jgi:hypothetical protein
MDDEPVFWFVDGEAFKGIAPGIDCFETFGIISCFALDPESIRVLIYCLDSWFVPYDCGLFDNALESLD